MRVKEASQLRLPGDQARSPVHGIVSYSSPVCRPLSRNPSISLLRSVRPARLPGTMKSASVTKWPTPQFLNERCDAPRSPSDMTCVEQFDGFRALAQAQRAGVDSRGIDAPKNCGREYRCGDRTRARVAASDAACANAVGDDSEARRTVGRGIHIPEFETSSIPAKRSRSTPPLSNGGTARENVS